jgi:glycosyltransferase involved in cell wall biosynthesis
MKVTITVPGRFHAFNLAYGLLQNNNLDKIITSYPAYILKSYGIPSKHVKSLIFKELYCRFYNLIYKKYPQSIFINILFDFFASCLIPKNSDIYILWAGFSKLTIKRIRKVNPTAKIILERGSTHIQFQYKILHHEYKNFPNINFNLPNVKLIQREIDEYNLVDYIAVPTEFTEKTFIDYGILKTKMFINPYGVDLDIFKEKKYNKVNNTLNILFTGNFSVRKGANIYLHVLKLCENKRYLKFTIVGTIESGLYEYLQPYISNGQVTFISQVPQKELPKIYQDADIFFFPSHEEGLGLVLLQAMASGLCIIASENSGFGSFANGENGYICNLTEYETIVKIFDKLYNNELLLLKHSKNTRNTVINNYSWEEYINRSLIFYKKIN